MDLKCIAVVMGGRSPEHAISLESGRAVLAALDETRYRGRAVVIGRDGLWSIFPAGRLPPEGEAAYEGGAPPEKAIGILRDWGVDVAFLALHGPFGEDGSVQGFFRILDIPFTASGIRASAVALDKPLSKNLLEATGIRTPRHIVVRKEEWQAARGVVVRRIVTHAGLPCFVKALRLGSSVGIFRVVDEDDLVVAIDTLLETEGAVMAERSVSGREISCGVLGNAGGELTTLPPVEIRPQGADFFDYRSKYEPGRADELCPAPIDDDTTWNVRAAARAVHEKIGARGFSRSDFILDGGVLWFLEVNTIPGLTRQSIIPKAAAAAGIGFSALVTQIIDLAQDTLEPAPASRTLESPRREDAGGRKPAEGEMG